MVVEEEEKEKDEMAVEMSQMSRRHHRWKTDTKETDEGKGGERSEEDNLTTGIVPSLNVAAGLLGFFFVKTWKWVLLLRPLYEKMMLDGSVIRFGY